MLKINVNDIIIRPLISEKTSKQEINKIYWFEVHKDATKPDIKRAIETVFHISEAKVEKVNVINVKRRKKRLGRSEGYKKGYKKAIVYLKSGTIPIFGKEQVSEIKNQAKPKKNRLITDDILNPKE